MPIESPFYTTIENGVELLSLASVPEYADTERDVMHSFMCLYLSAFKGYGNMAVLEHLTSVFRLHHEPKLLYLEKEQKTNGKNTDRAIVATRRIRVILAVYDELKSRIEKVRNNSQYQTMDDCIEIICEGYDLDYLKSYKRTTGQAILSSDKWMSRIRGDVY